MNTEFYLEENGQQVGPFTYEELKAKGIKRDTLIWTEGFDSWTKAENVAILKDLLRPTPPPLPNTGANTNSQQTPPIPPNVTPQQTDKYFGYELATISERFFAVLIESLILLVPILIIFGVSEQTSSSFSLASIIGGAIFSAILGAIFYSNWSGNLGHKILGLKVISSKDGKDQNTAGAGALREGLKNIFGNVLIPLIWLLWDDNRQNLYDKVVNTYVVKKK